MNYQKYYPVDVVNGPGTRCTLFVSGCEHACKGCYNQKTWRCDAGHPFDQAMVETIINDLNDPRIKRRGLSLSGGDPLHPNNLDAILDLVQQVKARTQGKDIWCWTGYTLAELNEKQKALLPFFTVLVDGKFEQDLANPSLPWRGSSNQQVIHDPYQVLLSNEMSG
ncbi:anaerobic ribonucleoside-triphosphate reductase-activating protein [Motilimonas cestriensis]|uniref:Anaerobic ribonucleoside-triphosphate reductase-activating protein n=1 Tax=Motilimonas cestriensis TaxID=2742685 RepID=A0ABS8WBC1_9GAMM|nr:anaerobic ribonucleoside-triphosphate reductase-activating protein [Motilimonas cestriensis]MCE2595084.1 anaerobic ribonucleoside-triphosphate reductase-activating protein [Motilimonas cestriensis]